MRKLSVSSNIAALAWVLVWCSPVAAAPFFTGLGDLTGGDFISRARGISADGTVVVGESRSASGQEAFRWTLSNGIEGLGDLAGDAFMSAAYGVSADGSVIVGYGTTSSLSGRRAFRWTQGTGMVSLGGSRASIARGVSADGTVIAGTVNSLPPSPTGNPQAFRWTQATGMVNLGFFDTVGADSSEGNGLSGDGSVVVGYSDTQAFRWTQATGLLPLPGLGGTIRPDIARAVSADGTVVVGSSDSTSSVAEEAFRYTQATGNIGLGDLPGGIYSSRAEAVSADGSIVVGSSSSDTSRAFIWDADHGMRNLQQVLSSYGLTSSLTGWNLSSATAISGNGRIIAGSGINPNGQTEAWIASLVPEPASLSLLIMCGATAAIWRPRRTFR